MRIAALTAALLIFAGSGAAQLGDVSVPDPTSGLPAPQIEQPGLPNVTVEPPIESGEEEPQQEDTKEPEAPPRDYQTVLWEDPAAAPVPDSFDLLDLRAWEVNLLADPEHPGAEGHGLMLRLLIQGSDPEDGYDRHVIAGGLYNNASGAESARPITLVLADDGWASSDTLIYGQTSTAGADIVPDVLAHPNKHVVHLFLPLADLAAPGDLLAGFTFVSQSSSTDPDSPLPATQFDQAPDGQLLIRDADDVQNASVEQVKGLASYFVQGAGHHLNVSGVWSAGQVSMDVHNPYQWPQTVSVAYPQGATPTTEMTALLAGNESIRFMFDAPRTQEARELQWNVRSDIGALAQMSLHLPALPPPPPPPSPAAPAPPAPEPEPEEDIVLERTDVVVLPPEAAQPTGDAPPIEEDKESPAGLWLVPISIALVVMLRRRA